MKRFLMTFSLVVLYTATVFGAEANISRTIPTKNINTNSTETNTSNRGVSVSRNTVRNTVRKNDTNNISRSVNTRKINNRLNVNEAANTIGRSARTESQSINADPSVRRAGLTLRASTAEVGGRATLANGQQTGSNIDEQVRGVQSRVSVFGSVKPKTVTAESLANAKDILEKTSDLNSTCQQQYNECMDQYCAVVDANQQRCSCSANLAKYAKAQEAVENANTELNDVAQQIRYVGLSADEIRAIMSATEAELVMNKTRDTTQTRSLLDDIADMIKDPTASIDLTGTSATNSLLTMDLDFSSDSSDLFSLDMFSSNTNDISSKRGTALYNEAKKRCKVVLNRCKDAGGTEDQIAGNYDLSIAKDCIAYEQGLQKLNTTLKNNVRSANLMLQKARLAVLQNKNEYDIKGCVAALENCMLDDMVCGDGYVKCLDPTKVYIDENGSVVLGRNLPNITNFMTNYNNTNINAEFIKSSVSDTTCPNHDGGCIVGYLMKKIGTGQTVKDGGLCRAVLDKCQDFTYSKYGKNLNYDPYNEVVVHYIQRAMVNIKAAQSRIISDYASTCMAEVEECYNQQNTQITSWSTSANVDNIYRVMTGACYNVALTCGYAVFAYDVEMAEETAALSTEPERKNALIRGISQMFYESLLCPDNSTFSTVLKNNATDSDKYVNNRCKCNEGFFNTGTACVASCPSGMYAHNRRCVLNCPENEYFYGDQCVTECPGGSHLYNGECKDECPTVAPLLSGNTCVASCPNNTPVALNNVCMAACPSDAQYVLNNRCVTVCPDGYSADFYDVCIED